MQHRQLAAVLITASLLIELGYTTGLSESVLIPYKRVQYLGFLVNTTKHNSAKKDCIVRSVKGRNFVLQEKRACEIVTEIAGEVRVLVVSSSCGEALHQEYECRYRMHVAREKVRSG